MYVYFSCMFYHTYAVLVVARRGCQVFSSALSHWDIFLRDSQKILLLGKMAAPVIPVLGRLRLRPVWDIRFKAILNYTDLTLDPLLSSCKNGGFFVNKNKLWWVSSYHHVGSGHWSQVSELGLVGLPSPPCRVSPIPDRVHPGHCGSSPVSSPSLLDWGWLYISARRN